MQTILNGGKITITMEVSEMKIISVKKYKQLEKQLFNHNEPDGCSSHEADEFLTLFDDYTTSQTFWQFLATPYYKIRNCHLFSKIKYAFQRMKKGYSDEDICEIDTWFLRVVPKMLREFKENCDEELFNTVIFCNRHPEDYACLPHTQTGYIEPTAEEEKQVLSEWLKAIDRMLELFEKAGEHSHLCYCCEEAQRRRQYLDEAFMLFSKYFNDLWW